MLAPGDDNNQHKTETIEISVWIVYRYLASEKKKDVDFIFYERDMDQSLCASSAHKLPHSRGALCIFPIGKFFFLKQRGKEC